MTEQSPVIWLLTDNKPGHLNQLRGLANRLRVLAGASTHWVEAGSERTGLFRSLFGWAAPMTNQLPEPDLIIAAGSRTHRLLLSLRRRGRTVVLMRPNFPRFLVDAVIAPIHDGLPEHQRVLATEGTLNRMVPLARLTLKKEALVLIGGPSPHFDWQAAAVMSQLRQLVARHPDWSWTISNSRRTPASLTTQLEGLESQKIKVVDHTRTHEDWLSHQLATSRMAWVTPDSSSMLSETLTAGVPTALLELPPNKGSRVALGVRRFLEKDLVHSYKGGLAMMTETNPPQPKLWEADRAARWLMERGLVRGRT
ncbi:hypothetical protein SAMN05216203_3494 [Marinobacter daqiaonensis]|uniref:Fission protein ELM1 n=1 Tax=Marinobacter daqiaonensis TaxID=650891 RepID=A0A1I6K2N9_9GAMM|nr:ELM1/GtrOC1 family putative glycosyltransferase [Marinobacter daqiaonensis]SFR85446.1 hypothetical protein SAMN05216203_3494 [Marinobacter daqiaonensis]